MKKQEIYRFRDGQTPLSASELNKRFFDIDARLHALETVKMNWEEAVSIVTEHGLERINNSLQPALNELIANKEASEQYISEIQAMRDAADEMINQNRDDAIAAIDSARQQALDEINANSVLIYAALAGL